MDSFHKGPMLDNKMKEAAISLHTATCFKQRAALVGWEKARFLVEESDEKE